MKDIIVVYPVKETAMALRVLIEKNGYHVSYICARGSSALEFAYAKQRGIIICPFIMSDMSSSDLAEQVPSGFDIIALSRSGSEQYMGNMIVLPLPIDSNDFIRTIAMLSSSNSSFTRRSESDSDYLSKAKQLLMSEMNMNEMQAHKYLQKQSMKSGKKMVAVAMDILDRLT